MTSPSPRVRGEGRGEGAYPPGSESRRGPLTLASLDLSPRAARDAARIDAGAKLAIKPNAWLFTSFDGEFSHRSQSYAGKGGVRVAW